MLALRPGCECCDKDLPPDSTEARICSFECTFCVACAEGVLHGVCPNCGGEMVPRPRRPAAKLHLSRIDRTRLPTGRMRARRLSDRDRRDAATSLRLTTR